MQCAWRTHFAAIAALFSLGGVAFGQVDPPAEFPRATGRDFAGLSMSDQILDGGIAMSADRARSWTETGAGGEVIQRLVLERDVAMSIGPFRFSAARAVVWIQTGATDSQVAVYFDRVANPAAEAGFGMEADRLLVTGVARGDITLKSDVLVRGRIEGAGAVGGSFVQESEARLALYLNNATTGESDSAREGGTSSDGGTDPWDINRMRAGSERPAGTQAQRDERIVPGESRPYLAPMPYQVPDVAPAEDVAASGAQGAIPIFPVRGTAAMSCGGSVVLRPTGTPGTSACIFTGGVVAQFIDASRARPPMEVSAQRAVVFLESDQPESLAQFDLGTVRGIYLEGDVSAGNGKYSVRGPRVYYDVRNDRALMLDAVFWTYDERRELPLYLRAEAISQQADNKFSALNATLATTSFADPHLRLGATSITVTRLERASTSSGGSTIVEADNVSVKIGPPGHGFPLFWYPHFKGDLQNFPLRDVRLESSSGSGAALKTTWSIHGLLNKPKPANFDADLLLDGYFDRGLGLGTDLAWRSQSGNGGLFAYGLPSDNGEDRLTSGARIEQDGDGRGILLGEHRWVLNDSWTVFLEAAYLSDETFADAFFEPLAETRREFTNSAYARRLDDNTSLTLLAKGSANDFVSNEYLLQSQGYSVSKLPEAVYTRLADDVLKGVAPGLVSYSSEYSLSRMSLNFNEPTASEMGFDTAQRAAAALGLGPNESVADRLSAQGFSESFVNRADTRQELSMTLRAGPVKFVPFLTGRLTAYDDEFESYTTGGVDEARLWGAAGARVSTTLQRINDGADSRWFDIHRLRHIIEPYAVAWSAGTNVEQGDLPLYDDEVESLADGSALKVGIDQTWQTMRGGPQGGMGGTGQRSVDVFKLNASLVESSEDADFESPIGRFFDYRPEHSLLGDYATLEAAWQATNAVSIGAGLVHDFDSNQPARSNVGAIIQHSEDFNTWGEVRHVNALDSLLASAGIGYRLTRKYRAGIWGTYDTDVGELQSINVTLARGFPEATFRLGVSYDNIANNTSFGIVFEPAGAFHQSPRFLVPGDPGR